MLPPATQEGTEVRKPTTTIHKARADQRRFILRELRKGTSVRLIAGALDLSTQRIYKIKKELKDAEELV